MAHNPEEPYERLPDGVGAVSPDGDVKPLDDLYDPDGEPIPLPEDGITPSALAARALIETSEPLVNESPQALWDEAWERNYDLEDGKHGSNAETRRAADARTERTHGPRPADVASGAQEEAKVRPTQHEDEHATEQEIHLTINEQREIEAIKNNPMLRPEVKEARTNEILARARARHEIKNRPYGPPRRH